MVEAETNILTEDYFSALTVSSVLEKKHKEYGKKFIYDGKDETCWNSDSGLP
jgi:hypothetical protein